MFEFHHRGLALLGALPGPQADSLVKQQISTSLDRTHAEWLSDGIFPFRFCADPQARERGALSSTENGVESIVGKMSWPPCRRRGDLAA